jgi:hypothetical protein
MKLGPRLRPLRKTVVEGIVAQKLEVSGGEGAQLDELSSSVHQELAISLDDAKSLVLEATASLEKDGLCKIQNELIVWCGGESSPYEIAVSTLVRGVLDRYVVREGGVDDPAVTECLSVFFSQLLRNRGWDLGAAFASNRSPELVQVRPVLESISACKQLAGAIKLQPLIAATEDLLTHPNSEQATLLAELGRLAFGLELVVQAPHDSLFHSLTLPEKIYLDANVLMPALTMGHSYHRLYRDTIDNLLKGAASASIDVRVNAYAGFLNEIVSHRRLAIDEIVMFEPDLRQSLVKECRLFGSENLNVFVGAYAEQLASGVDLTFEAFLTKYAPYESEEQLASWLEKQGVHVLSERDVLDSAERYPDILHALEMAYAEDNKWNKKDAVLIRHDAAQLGALDRDIEAGVRSIFVSADRRLRDKVASGKFSYLANAMVSHLGLTQLIDLLVGLPVDARGLTRMIWTTQISSDAEQVRKYLVDLALNEYDAATAIVMHDLVAQVADDAVQELKEQGLGLNVAAGPEKARTLKVINVFEDKFFTTMRELVEKIRK